MASAYKIAGLEVTSRIDSIIQKISHLPETSKILSDRDISNLEEAEGLFYVVYEKQEMDFLRRLIETPTTVVFPTSGEVCELVNVFRDAFSTDRIFGKDPFYGTSPILKCSPRDVRWSLLPRKAKLNSKIVGVWINVTYPEQSEFVKEAIENPKGDPVEALGRDSAAAGKFSNWLKEKGIEHSRMVPAEVETARFFLRERLRIAFNSAEVLQNLEDAATASLLAEFPEDRALKEEVLRRFEYETARSELLDRSVDLFSEAFVFVDKGIFERCSGKKCGLDITDKSLNLANRDIEMRGVRVRKMKDVEDSCHNPYYIFHKGKRYFVPQAVVYYAEDYRPGLMSIVYSPRKYEKEDFVYNMGAELSVGPARPNKLTLR